MILKSRLVVLAINVVMIKRRN